MVKQTLLIAGISALALATPALAQGSDATAHSTAIVLAQALPPTPPPAVAVPPAPPPAVVAPPAPTTAIAVAPTAPPPPEVETPPLAPPGANLVWDPGHWNWNGSNFVWVAGTFIERPAATAALVPGHWEQRVDGWDWIPATWEYSGTGSSLPPQ
jgi:hypothetical protein